MVIAMIAAVGAHGAVLALALTRSEALPPPPKKELPIVVATRPPPPPAPEPEKPPPAKAHAPPPPAAAQTAKVIAQAASDAPADLTDFAIVTGKSETFAGGYSASAGTGKAAVANPQATAKPTPAPPSQARAAAPARRDWSCSWPADAEESDLKEAFVTISVTVDENGSAQRVDIVKSPAATFAEAARSCALAERYEAARDSDGRRVAAQTPHFLVHFFR
jgi:protein TonB